MGAAHRFISHDTGQSLLEAKLTSIAAAQLSVVMETFIFRDSDIGRRFREALRQGLLSAKDVAITSAYFLPSHRLRQHLAQAVARGARVRLLLAGKSDVPLMQLASRSLYRRLVNQGIEIWEYQPQGLV